MANWFLDFKLLTKIDLLAGMACVSLPQIKPPLLYLNLNLFGSVSELTRDNRD